MYPLTQYLMCVWHNYINMQVLHRFHDLLTTEYFNYMHREFRW
jgi:hypothetical protein